MDKNSVVAFVLILLVLFMMPFYYKIFSPPPEPSVADSSAVVADSAKSSSPETIAQKTAPLKESPSSSSPEIQTKQTAPARQEPSYSAADVDTFVIETEDYWTTITNVGGGTFQSVKLKKYLGPNQEPYVELIPENEKNVLAFEAIGFEGDTINYANKLFQSQPPEDTNSLDTLVIQKRETFTFRYSAPNGGTIVRSLTFYPRQYQIGLKVTLQHFQDEIANRQYQVAWNSGLAITENNIQDDLTYSKAYGLLGDELIDIDAGKAKPGSPVKQTMEGTTKWVAVRNKYFAAIITPVTRNAIGTDLAGTRKADDALALKRYRASVVMPYTESATQQDSFIVYIGPLDYSILKSYNRDFQRMMNFGWKIIRPISKAVLWAFTHIHKYIPNYGWVLILFGIAVKILVFPLTKKSYVSMKEMQVLGPKVQELKEKYKDDSQKMNQEMMKIYKEHGVNPMGGCLPMVIQMPLLYALFIVFRTTIELRNAGFVWWIKDLSQPDTIFTLPFSLPLYGSHVNVLPIIMGITMIIQQQMTTSAASQQQKMMTWLMPIIFLLIFNNFPSGLNLYYALFNIMTIVQQKWFIDVPTAPQPVKS